MQIKCGRRMFSVTNKDLIHDNGHCYQLITQRYNKGWDTLIPMVSKKLFNQLLKENKIVRSKKKYSGLFGKYDLYEFVDVESEDEDVNK